MVGAFTMTTQQSTELINGQDLPIGTLAAFCRRVYGRSLLNDQGRLPGQPGEPMLGIEKFKVAAGKFYRLVWIGPGKAWLAGEDTERYPTKIQALTAGSALARQTGAKFSEATR